MLAVDARARRPLHAEEAALWRVLGECGVEVDGVVREVGDLGGVADRLLLEAAPRKIRPQPRLVDDRQDGQVKRNAVAALGDEL